MSLTVDAKKSPATSPPAVSVPVAPPVPPAAASPGSVLLSADTPAGPDFLGRAADAAYLAELVTHQATGSPFCIGLFGAAGSGKSAFLGSLLLQVERMAEAAEEAGLATPFLSNIAVVRVEVQAGASPAASLLQQTRAALAASHPRLAVDASHAGMDPRVAARVASSQLNEARQQLDVERRSLDELTGRQARLAESVLFDNAGSRVDAYARANRARIERSLRRFGFQGDPIASYKELVREASEPGGTLAQKPGWLRAFWAYRGQTRLVVIAIAFFAIAWGLSALIGNEGSLIDAVRSSNDKMTSTADWLQAHVPWLQFIKQVFEIGGVVALAMNVLRGIRFLQPVIRGASLLQGDLETRRRDLDSLLAHQTRRVDTLASEAEAASHQASEAESRLATSAAAGYIPMSSSMSNGAQAEARDADAARSFFEAVAHAILARSNDRLPSSASAAPTRLLVGIDGFDHVPSEQASAFLASARALLSHPGIVTVIAADRTHLAAGLAETDPALATAHLNRLVQIPYAIGADEGTWPDSGKLVRALLKGGPTEAPGHGGDALDVSRSALDMAWLQSEGAVLEALAPFAGRTPRAVKRFVNLYRVARADPRMRGGTAQDLAALAVALALQAAGSPQHPRGYGNASGSGAPDMDLHAARKAASGALGATLNLQDARRGLETARLYSAVA